MKRFISFSTVLVLMFVLFSGCSDSADTQEPIINNNTSDLAHTLIEQIIDKPIPSDSINISHSKEVDGTTVYYADQTYNGIEICNSSLVMIDEEEPTMIGSYFDLSSAFDESFSTLTAQAAQVPNWMVDGDCDDVQVTYHTDTLKPVIFISEDTPVVARKFDLSLSLNDSAKRYTLVTDLAGETCYEFETDLLNFQSTQLKDGTNVAKKGNVYYAYDMEHRFLIGKDNTTDDDVLDSYYDGSGSKTNANLIYQLGGNKDQTALTVMGAMSDVMEWYHTTFGYYGVDGNGGEAMCVIDVDYDSLSSIAANACENGHVFIFATSDYGETAADAPEILAHEMGHAVLKNLVHLSNKNQAGSLHEAISDTFACLFDSDGDWVIGDGLQGVTEKNISKNNRTMNDFLYDWQFNNDKEYIGDSAIQTYIRKKFVDESSCSSGKVKYSNAEIISGALYKIWKNVFNKNSDLFGKVLMDCLQYLPQNASFYQFRDAFLYSTGKLVNGKTAERVGTRFDTVGVYKQTHNYVAIYQQETPEQLLNVMEMTYGQLRMLEWDGFYFTGDDNNWSCQCEKSGFSMNVNYYHTAVETPEALPDALYLFNYNATLYPVPVMKDLAYGMTYQEIKERFDITPLENTEYQSPEYPVLAHIETDKYTLELYFSGYDETAVFEGIYISRK